MPPGTAVGLAGKIEEARETQRKLLLASASGAFLVVLLLYLALGRWREVAVVLGTLPLAFAGGLFALYLAGGTWNASSIVGVIGLFGVAVQNSLVLITQTKELLARGLPFREALREAEPGAGAAQADDRRRRHPRPPADAARLRRLGARASAGGGDGRRPRHLDPLHPAGAAGGLRPIRRASGGGGEALSTQAFRIRGMDCAEEVAILKRAVGPLVGDPEALLFDVMAGKMIVPATVAPEAVVAAVAATGMQAEPWQGRRRPRRRPGAPGAGAGGAGFRAWRPRPVSPSSSPPPAAWRRRSARERCRLRPGWPTWSAWPPARFSCCRRPGLRPGLSVRT